MIYPFIQFFKSVRGHIIAMTMNPNCVIKGFNVFKDKSVSMFEILNVKAVKPFSFYQGMKGLDAGIVIWVSGV